MRSYLPILPIAATIVAGYPLAAFSVHGVQFALWPAGIETPSGWYRAAYSSFGVHIVATYIDMLSGRSSAFVDGGLSELLVLFGPAFLLTFLLTKPQPIGPRRFWQPIYGGARFATVKERSAMRVGLELGKDPDTGRTIRVAVKSNLLSIAPARTGKTSGLLLPNLVAPENSAWFGPAVVIDPKGDTYRATAERRRGLERQVYCLDPFGIVDGGDRWNPIGLIDVNDIAYLQRLARALLPAPGAHEQHYFRDASVNPIVAAFLAAKREGHATPRRVAEFFAQPRLFEAALAGATDIPSLETLALLQGDEKTSAPILSTARQAFQWCADDRMARLTAKNTVNLDEVCKGRADLFVAVPTENLEQVAPFLRWLLNDLFNSIRRNKPRQRVMIFIDEARALGRFDEIVTAYGELPGYNGSLWTFWQTRAQITSLYGPDGARTLIANAEVLSFSDPSPADPDETDLWSRALGEYTIEEESKTITEATRDKPGSTSIGKTLKGVRLMSQDAVATLSAADLLVIVNSQSYTKRPLRIRKTHYLDERLTPYVKDVGATVESI